MHSTTLHLRLVTCVVCCHVHLDYAGGSDLCVHLNVWHLRSTPSCVSCEAYEINGCAQDRNTGSYCNGKSPNSGKCYHFRGYEGGGAVGYDRQSGGKTRCYSKQALPPHPGNTAVALPTRLRRRGVHDRSLVRLHGHGLPTFSIIRTAAERWLYGAPFSRTLVVTSLFASWPGLVARECFLLFGFSCICARCHVL